MSDLLDRAHDFAIARRAMIDSQLRTSGVNTPRVLAAFSAVAREDFVPADRRDVAYTDRPVPLGDGRALNPPATTAALFDAAAILPGDRVLVIGSAYAAAIAAQLTDAVVSEDAGKDDTVQPAFDVILIDGAVEALPASLVDRLAPGGRVATGRLDRGVTRLALGRRGGHGFALVDFADAEAVALPGFAKPKSFVF
mgnify:CR=1 FL=1